MEYLLLLSSIVAGAFTVLKLRLEERGYVHLFNAFTGAYLLSLTFLHLLPELYHEHDGPGLPHVQIGVLVLVGFFIQIGLDTLSLGVEHGHRHRLIGRVPTGVIVGLCLHAFIEATSLGDRHTHHDLASRRMLLWSIVIHNYPVSIALLGMLLHAGMRRNRALGWLGLFGLMGPLGMMLGASPVLAQYTRQLTALVIGIFLHLSTTILFESSDVHRFDYPKIGAILLGVALGSLTVALH